MSYHPVRTQRGLEILTGLIPWVIILFPFVGSFFIPDVVAYFVIAFNVYWLYRSLQMTIYAIAGYLNVKATQKIDWLAKLKDSSQTKDGFTKINHLVIIPTVNEPLSILERNLDAIAAQKYDLKKVHVVLAMEERAGEKAHQIAKELSEKYQKKFAEIYATFHILKPGETMGKHSNDTYAAKTARDNLYKDKIDLDTVLVTVCDADGVLPDNYLALLTYKFLSTENRFHKFFQAPQFTYNNLHRVPLLVRLPSVIGNIYMLSILQKLSKRFMISAIYSTSLNLLETVGYWDLDFIPEDWHLYLKSYFTLKGDVSVIPLYLPIYIDAAESTSRWKTFRNSYEQLKRWAWGSVDIPYVVKQFFKHPEIPLIDRLVKISAAIEWHFVWSSSWFLITLGATIPTVLNPVFARTTLGLNLSRISGSILTICLVGLLTIIFIDTLMDPNKKHKIRTLLHPFTYLQWLLLPVFGFFFGSLPGLESQTRLMFGKYIEYRVTEKVTK